MVDGESLEQRVDVIDDWMVGTFYRLDDTHLFICFHQAKANYSGFFLNERMAITMEAFHGCVKFVLSNMAYLCYQRETAMAKNSYHTCTRMRRG
jgi:hypothetical protein